MEFKQGTFKRLRVTHKVHLGAIPMDLPGDIIIEFDGVTLKYGGKEYSVPGLAGGYNLGWLVDAEDNVSQYIPQPAGLKVHSATSSGTDRQEAMAVERASEDEQEVGTLKGSNDRRKTANMAPLRLPVDAPVSEPKARPQRPAPPPPPVAKVAKPASPKKAMVVETDSVPIEVNFKSGGKKTGGVKRNVITDQNEGAVAVAKLRPAKASTMLVSAETSSSVDGEINKLTSVNGNSPPKVEKFAVVRDEQDQGESITKTFKNGATGDVAETMSGEELSDILPDAASSGLPKSGVVKTDDTPQVAKGNPRRKK